MVIALILLLVWIVLQQVDCWDYVGLTTERTYRRRVLGGTQEGELIFVHSDTKYFVRRIYEII